MSKLLELVIVLCALTFPPFVSSVQGENIGKQEAERTARGMATSAAIVAIYQAFKRYNKEEEE